MSEIIELIKKIPKAELHLHIEGSLEPDLMFKLAKRNNIKIPFKTVDEVKTAYNFHNLQSFLDIYYQGAKVLIKEKDFFDLTWSYMLKCKENNVVHTEIFFINLIISVIILIFVKYNEGFFVVILLIILNFDLRYFRRKGSFLTLFN